MNIFFQLHFFLLTKGCHTLLLPLIQILKTFKYNIMEKTATTQQTKDQVISPAQLLEHWQGHRGLTRRVIEAFPEKELFEHQIGGMRPFSEMVAELLAIAVPGLEEIVSKKTVELREKSDFGHSKAKILELWDESTEKIDMLWNQIGLARFQEYIKLFGQY